MKISCNSFNRFSVKTSALRTSTGMKTGKTILRFSELYIVSSAIWSVHSDCTVLSKNHIFLEKVRSLIKTSEFTDAQFEHGFCTDVTSILDVPACCCIS